MEKAMKEWTTWLFYGMGASIVVLSWIATSQLDDRLKSIETQLDIQAQIIDKLRN
jgi:hypothetical protein